MDDNEKIKQTALNYIEGWYEGNSDRMKKALYPKLAKRRITSLEEAWEVDTKWMISATEEGKGKVVNITSAKREVEILDIQNKLASVKVISEKFIDYLHLTKIDDKWMIVNVLWDYI